MYMDWTASGVDSPRSRETYVFQVSRKDARIKNTAQPARHKLAHHHQQEKPPPGHDTGSKGTAGRDLVNPSISLARGAVVVSINLVPTLCKQGAGELCRDDMPTG